MKFFCFPWQFYLLRLCCISTYLFLFAAMIPVAVPAQTDQLWFTPIPYSEPDIVSPGRGAEQWESGGESVNYPYPDVSSKSLDVYHRFPWTSLEDAEAGRYNWNYFDNLVKNAVNNGQKLSFGIMPVFNGAGTVFYDGATSAYPLYLHNAMQAGEEGSRDWISNGIWIPNWNHSYYLSRLRALHVALNSHILNSSYKGVAYKDVIYCIDIRGYGNYGEWHNSGIVYNVKDYPAGRRATAATLKTIIDHHTQVFAQWPLSLMIAAFDAEQYDAIMNPAEVTYYALTTRNEWGPLGWRRDQWGATDPYLDKILKNNEKRFGTSPAFKELITSRYLTSPITGEPPSYVNAGGSCDYWDLERQLMDYGATSLGNGNWGKKLSDCGKENARAAFKRAGYRIILEGGNISSAFSPGRPFAISIAWKNIGIAPTYENWDVYFEMKNESNQVVWSGMSSFKPKLFPPNPEATITTDSFVLPADIASGNYTMELIIKDPTGYRAPLPLAIRGRNSSGSYILKELFVSPATCDAPTATIKYEPSCNGQPGSLVLNTATGTGPYDLVINGTTYNGITTGQKITTLAPPIERLWTTNLAPDNFIDSPVELGLKFRTSVSGMITGIRFFSPDAPSGIYTGHLWSASGKLLESVDFTNVTSASWQEALFAKPVTLSADSSYIISYHSSSGRYVSTQGGLRSGLSRGSIVVESETQSGSSGIYRYGPSGSFPVQSYNAANYWVDLIFSPLTQTYTLTSIRDSKNCGNTGNLQSVGVNFSDDCGIASDGTAPPDNGLSALLSNTPACSGEPFSLVLQSANGTGPYNLVINSVNYPDISVGQTITTVQPAVQTIWDEQPETITTVDLPVELGMKFRPLIEGNIKGIRFFSPSNPSGVYTGHLWTLSGKLIDSIVFSNVTPNSWQEALFSSPVKVSADSTYIVSYHTPGRYVSTDDYLKSTITSGFLTVPGDNVNGSNSVYRYGPSGSFPSQSYRSANYWVDVLFEPGIESTYTFELTGITDKNGLAKTGSLQTLTVVSSDNCDAAPDEVPSTATLGYTIDCSTQSLNLILNTAEGAAPFDLVINDVLYPGVMPGQIITTATAPSQNIWDVVPSPLSETDQPVELGVKFRSSTDGYIRGIRFFSPSNPTGVYTGNLWSSTGELLSSAEFRNVTASGWQEVLFSSPVFIEANSVFIASYHTSTGRYASTVGGLRNTVTRGTLTVPGDGVAGGNGVYRYGMAGSFPNMTYNASNYWVDVVFSSDPNYTYTYNLTSITDNNGIKKTGNLQSLNISLPGCEEAQHSLESSVSSSRQHIATKTATAPVESHEYNLEQNTPNPFSQYTTIRYSLSKPGNINLALYDINGRLVKVMVNAWKEPGTYSVQLEKNILHAGLYFYKMQTGDFSSVKKLVIQ